MTPMIFPYCSLLLPLEQYPVESQVGGGSSWQSYIEKNSI